MGSVPARAKVVSSVLFRAHLKAGRLRDMVASAKAVGDTVCFSLDNSGSTHTMSYWADDADKGNRPTVAMEGSPKDSIFEAVAGDEDQPHTFRVPSKHLLQCIAIFDGKRLVEMRLERKPDDEAHYDLILQQEKDEGEKPDVRVLTVDALDAEANQPIRPSSPDKSYAYAPVDLDKISRVLTGLRPSTNIVTVSIRPGEFEIHTSTRNLEDGWKHATLSKGNAESIFGVAVLKKAVAGAKAIGAFGEVHLSPDPKEPIHIGAVCEDLVVNCFVASSGAMK